MLDITLRPLKDAIFNPLCHTIPPSITPLHVTTAAFLTGLASCSAAARASPSAAVTLWLVNRGLDCLDGALARHRGQASDLGGFLDLLGDFLIYGLIPIACGYPALSGRPHESVGLALSLAFAVHSFFINNFVLFFVAAVLEKRKAAGRDESEVEGLTSVAMRPALIEGAESGFIFTVMLAVPRYTEALCWLMTLLVFFGTGQRVFWVVPALG